MSISKYYFSFTIILACLMLVIACDDNDTPGGGMIDSGDNEPIDAVYAPESYTLEYPDHFPRPNIPEDNPFTVQGIELGRHLFYDPILSSDSTQSCFSCHGASMGFADGLAVSTGVLGIEGTRSSMPLINLAFNEKGFFWDGRSATLEEQALLPIEDHIELNESWDNVITKLKNHERYPAMFREAFGIDTKGEITKELAAKALAQFERTLVSGTSRFDKIVWNSEGWPTDSEQRGKELFSVEFAVGTQAHPGCSHCHGSQLFTENGFFNNGITEVEDLNDFPDRGLGGVTGNVFDNGKFRAPTLRNIVLTAPYMHDGRFKTLEEVLEHYASGGHYAENTDPNIQPFPLSEQNKEDLISFLNMLTDTAFINNPAFQNPFN
jgi:cytochrome c peroxidase